MAKKTQRAPVVLVVDDEEPVRRLLRRILETAAYQVMEACDGSSAIALLEDDTPLDLLVADMEMPNLLGDEMARRIRAKRPDLKVLFVTGHADRLFEEQPLLWEGEAFLDKPFTANSLLEAVSLLLYGTLSAPPRN
jgi:two-component system, cell cycle sensor histidine kinase and response regulator CckA